jgi:hypothetical protein
VLHGPRADRALGTSCASWRKALGPR